MQACSNFIFRFLLGY